jgi:rhamnosyltransferase subunit B
MITSEPFRDVAQRNGMEFVPTLSSDEYSAMTNNPDLWHPKKGLKVILDRKLMQKHFPTIFNAIRERYVRGETVAIGGTLGFAARIANEVLGIPYATAHLQPMSCCSVEDPPVHSTGANFTWLPRPLIRAAYWGAEKWITDPLMAPAINEFRATLGLSPARRILTRWSPSPQRVIGLFPDWFGLIPDGGPAFRHSGFVLFDDAAGRKTPDSLASFLAACPPPVIFSFGSAMRHGRPYFEAAIEACQILNVRGVLLGAQGEQIPEKLPANIHHASYAPFSEVFPKAACVVHHGGLGTSAQGLRAGVPHLVMPLAYDQADNAVRMRRLKPLLEDDGIKQAASVVSQRFRTMDGAATAATLLEELVGQDVKPAERSAS